MHDDEDMDNELEVPPPMHSSTPVRGTGTEEDETPVTPDETDLPQILPEAPTTWSNTFIP